jgi:hypothetical protein
MTLACRLRPALGIKLKRRVTSQEKKIAGRAGKISPQLRDSKQ